jgi:flagellar assembly factor FliW
LPGFESCRRYVLLQSDEFAPGVCLRGLDAPAPAFFLMDPRHVDPSFAGELSSADRARLGAAEGDKCLWLVMLSVVDGEHQVNMRAPIVINPATMRGIQVLPADVLVAAPVPAPLAEVACLS